MQIVYIHGATASERSFAFIQESLKFKKTLFLNYDKTTSADTNLKIMQEKLDQETGPFFFICHSLGGVYAVYLQQKFLQKTKSVISLSTPFAGSENAIWGSILNPGFQLFKDIQITSDFIRQSFYIEIKVPWTQVISTVGDVPWIRGANDGVVTRRSMTYRSDVKYAEIDRNHYEIVLSKRVVDLIRNVYKST